MYDETVTEKETKPEALLIAVDDDSANDFEYMLDEMRSLIEACDMKVRDTIVQILENPNPATYVGKGKLEEVRMNVDAFDVEYVIFADNLSPAQLKNITNEINCAVFDRTGLILEIFARRARTIEARLQVESANLQYMLPRLVGMRTSLGRQGGASGSMSNKGQGEKQIELDRRHIEKRLHELNRELESIEHDRKVQRARRSKNHTKSVALVGYTNAGKSTIMNYLLKDTNVKEEKQVFEKDMLFATLDTTVRRIESDDNKDFLLTDTVGFVSNLPHGLVKAFRSTLDEVRYADLLLVVLDVSDKYCMEQLEVTQNTLSELECMDIPKIFVLNKVDRQEVADADENYAAPPKVLKESTTIRVSARTGYNMEELVHIIKNELYRDNETATFLIPYTNGDLINLINSEGHVLATEYIEEGTRICADVPGWVFGRIKQYIAQ